ncbi:asparagine synthase (glutamine-hydrolyzing) [Solidesulfovibrio fructosivorans JJ]]|uniref:asparagine synthase (glutamine-hydrolyzing) n=1 Tax=Solidesulfovibrio fructosivorans JJ] TaxID=596151 RepID=E1JSP3_SOLFR|nr:asparagine synthase (glutamine-hydrolyzing) [Solidesulfovibrio fructosivorans]EFL52526.1 asparagine synthase (glutamine-hydrolyzing) [Solidesulfovibrio fructosivorans JJ]]
MCGICGFVATRGGRAELTERLDRMCAAIAHRGPDGQGVYADAFADGGGVWLGHRRLAVIDLVTGDQPLFNETRSLAIVFNGEIYNFKELREELIAKGHVFTTRSDTEAIIHLYEEMGPACATRLRGMFALAIWDAGRRELFLARDPFGKKPLYYTETDGGIVFGSEIKALFAVPGVSARLDASAVAHYLTLQHVPEPATGFAGIKSLPAGHTLSWRDGQTCLTRYFRLDYLPKLTGSEDALAEELRQRVTEAVRLRLVADVPLGAHLSGGVDSGIITAVMAGLTDRPVRTFSIGFAEEAFSETAKARAVAGRFGTEHTEFTLRFDDARAVMEDVAAATDMPFADPSALAAWHLCKLTRQHVTVALNGDGGDEMFAGYQRYWLDPLADVYARLPNAVTRSLVPWLANLIPSRGDVPVEADWRAGIARLAQAARIPRTASLVRWGSYFSPWDRHALLRPEFERASRPADTVALYEAFYAAANAEAPLDHNLFADVSVYLPGDLLVKADRMAMAHALEGRSPFLDSELASFAARLPVRCKLRGRNGKYLLRKAFAHLLPTGIASQPKRGFGLPLAGWFKGPLREFARDLLTNSRLTRNIARPEAVAALLDAHERGQADHGKRLYALVMLELWLRRYLA